MSDKKTPEDRRHDIKMLWMGFVLTTVLGGALTACYKWLEDGRAGRALAERQLLELTEQRRTAATELFDELVPLIDKRMFRLRQVVWALEHPDDKQRLADARSAYRELLLEWNSRLNRNRALLCRFYGPEIGEEFEVGVTNGLREAHQQLVNVLAGKAQSSLADLEATIDHVNEKTYTLSDAMAEAIRSGEVGSAGGRRRGPASEKDRRESGV